MIPNQSSPPRPGQQIAVDMRTARKINCPKCGGKYFRIVHQIVIVPAVANPTGKEILTTLDLFQCTSCGRAKPIQEIEKYQGGKLS